MILFGTSSQLSFGLADALRESEDHFGALLALFLAASPVVVA